VPQACHTSQQKEDLQIQEAEHTNIKVKGESLLLTSLSIEPKKKKLIRLKPVQYHTRTRLKSHFSISSLLLLQESYGEYAPAFKALGHPKKHFPVSKKIYPPKDERMPP